MPKTPIINLLRDVKDWFDSRGYEIIRVVMSERGTTTIKVVEKGEKVKKEDKDAC